MDDGFGGGSMLLMATIVAIYWISCGTIVAVNVVWR